MSEPLTLDEIAERARIVRANSDDHNLEPWELDRFLADLADCVGALAARMARADTKESK